MFASGSRTTSNSFTASGLYYLSELVEEHTVLTRKLLSRLIYTIIAAQILLALVDRFPVLLSLLSIGSHVVYMGNLRHFPVVKLTDPIFIASCGESACPAGRIVGVLANQSMTFKETRASL